MLVIVANIEPVLFTESLWMATWFVVGLAFTQAAREPKPEIEPSASA
jgi:hypothetical protein